MTVQRMDNVLVVVEDLDAVTAFFVTLGLELQSRDRLEGRWVDQVIGIDDVRQTVAVLRTPDGRSGVELAQFDQPASVRPHPSKPPVNALGLRRIMFAVDDIDDTIARLRQAGAELVGEIVTFESSYRLCYLRGPEEILVGLAQELS